ncbi:MAG TPA: L-histidine N(alpha)-methyltransferase [Acidimicrobiia bacterium]
MFNIDVHLGADELTSALRSEASAGLGADPKQLSPKWFYDDRGSQLFDAITRLPEYYPTRSERAILEARAMEIAQRSNATTLVELGSGTSEKTRLLLDALREHGTLNRFVPFDVSEQTLRDAAEAIESEYPGVDVHAVVGDFERHLRLLPTGGRRLVAFLGGTIGNLAPHQRAEFLSTIAAGLAPGDTLLLGTDLVKPVERLVKAYDDSQGVTAAFNRNVLLVLNRELGATFDTNDFDHLALWNDESEWIEMRLRARSDLKVEITALDTVVAFAAGEEIRTEISAKFRRERVEQELMAAGLQLTQWWTDHHGDFALSLSTPI